MDRLRDPRLGPIGPGSEVVLKAARPTGRVRLRGRRPSGAEVEHERAMWGPHPDPRVDWIERQFYGLVRSYLQGLLRATLGRADAVLKADAPKPPGWGEVMALFQAPVPPEEKLATWRTLLDGFSSALLPATTVENAVAAWALRSALVTTIGDRIKALTVPGAWDAHFHTLPPAQQEIVAWSKLRGAEFVTKISASARQSILDALVEAEVGGGNHHDLSRVLFDRMGTLNRDWRRIAITETGMAVANGQLAAALAKGGDWEAVWVAGPKACPFCLAQQGRVFRVVPASHPGLDGETMIWPGKHNVGRSSHPYRLDGTKRSPKEMWHPCIPAHPNCACVWTIRRALASAAAKGADALLAKLRAQRFGAAVKA